MKKNDVLRKDDLRLRILVINDTCCLCIKCDAASMPFWIAADELASFTADTTPAANTVITPRQKQIAHERFTLIAPMLAFLTDDKERNRLMNITAKQHGISKQTLRRYLCRYLVYQDISALAPALREERQELNQDQKNMRWALNKYFYSPKKSCLTEVYVKLLKEKYCDAEGKLVPGYPTMRQFRYHERKESSLAMV